MTAHIHAENMLLYAKDAAETDRPWERWRFKPPYPLEMPLSWEQCKVTPLWWTDWVYERIPQTITVNGVKVQKPLSEAPQYQETYYTADPDSQAFYNSALWVNDQIDRRRLERGLIHLTAEAAIAHVKAMLRREK